MSSFHIGTLQVKPESRDKLLASFEGLKAQSGFISQTIFVSDEDENKFTTIEEWESAGDHAKFLASMPEGALEGWMSMLETPPTSEFFTKK